MNHHKTKDMKDKETAKKWNRVFIDDGESHEYLDGLTQEQMIELIYGFKKKK